MKGKALYKRSPATSKVMWSTVEKVRTCLREGEKHSDAPPEDKNPPKALASPPETGPRCVRIVWVYFSLDGSVPTPTKRFSDEQISYLSLACDLSFTLYE